MRGSHISLFAGVGMTDKAAEGAGFKTVATAEIDPWNRKVLEKRFPDAQHFSDVKDVRISAASRHALGADPETRRRSGRGPLLVSGGFPCQDVSSAGTGKGVVNGTRSGLWVEFKRVIHEFQPDYVLIENSPMLKTRGLHVFLADLHEEGYDAHWDCLPAAAFGAPHLRDRIFIVAWKQNPHGPFVLYGEIARGVGGVLTATNSDPSIPLVASRLPRAGEMCHGVVVEAEAQAPIKLAKTAHLAGLVGPGWPPCPATGSGFWPTPAASLPNDGEQPDTWLARRAALKAKGINGNGAGIPLSIAVRMFPTPRAAANEWRTTRNAPSHGKTHGKTLAGEINDLERAAGRTPAQASESAGNVNPVWVEWMMGLDLGWTDLTVPNSALVPHPGWGAEPLAVPRTMFPSGDRKARLAALGNGLVWQCAAYALTMIPEGV